MSDESADRGADAGGRPLGPHGEGRGAVPARTGGARPGRQLLEQQIRAVLLRRVGAPSRRGLAAAADREENRDE